MPDEITITPKSEPLPTNPNQASTAADVRGQLTSLCALGLGVSFFLPWANVFFGIAPSGFDLQKHGGGQLLLWAIPLFSIITIIAGLAKSNQPLAARLAGVLPFAVGTYWFVEIGPDLLHMLTFGAYLSLAFGAGLLILPKSK